MRTPERAVWPLPPRPACLPLPEPMPRPTRMRAFEEPGIVADFVEFHRLHPHCAVDDAHEMRDLGDHAASGGRVDDGGAPADLVEAEADQRLALVAAAADGAARSVRA